MDQVIEAMRILVTRPEPDAATTAAELRRLGHEPILAPMLTTQFVDWRTLDAPPVPNAVVTTSPNGIRGLLDHPSIEQLKQLTLYVVGDASARLAESVGFENVVSAKGDVSDLAGRLCAERRAGETILYASGRDISGDLEGALGRHGFHVDRIEVYRAVRLDNLEPAVSSALQAGSVDVILIFSARTGEAFVKAAEHAGCLTACRDVPIHAISAQAAEPLRHAGFRSIMIALRPDTAELLDTLHRKR